MLALGLVALAGAAGHEDVIAYAAPLLGVVLPLVAGRYIGEDKIVRVAGRLQRRTRRPELARARMPRRRRRLAALVPRGPRLLATALAERAPPPVLLA
jgi:hypothetical protein